jgi:hypothetical protein
MEAVRREPGPPMWVRRDRLSGTCRAVHQLKRSLTAAFPLVRGLSVLVGDTGFEPVTSSVSGQNPCVGTRANVASGACGGSPMYATVRAGWPTVWPTTSRCRPTVVSAASEQRLYAARRRGFRPRISRRLRSAGWLQCCHQRDDRLGKSPAAPKGAIAGGAACS